MKKQKQGLFSKIHNIDDAQKMTKDTAYGFYALAALQGAIGLFLSPALIIDAIVIALLAFFLHKFKSRVAAILLLLMSILMMYSTFQNKINGGGEGGKNIILALVALIIAVRAVEAAFKCRRYKKAAK